MVSCLLVIKGLSVASSSIISSLAAIGEMVLTLAALSASLAVPGFSSLVLPGVFSLATLTKVVLLAAASPASLAMLHEGQKGLDHGFKELDETSWISSVLLLATAALGLQVHQVIPL